MKDTDSLEGLGLTEEKMAKAFLVLMIKKPKKEKKTPAAATPSATTPAAPAAAAAPAPPAAAAAAPSPVPFNAPAVTPPAAPAAVAVPDIPANPAASLPANPAVPANRAPAPAAAVVTPEDQAKIDMLVNMGLGDAATAQVALQAAFGNVDVAANYMMSPELMANIQQNAGQGDFNIPMNPAAGGMGGMPEGLPAGLEDMNEEQLLAMMQQQPEMFAPLIEEIARQDPALLQEIQANPQRFLGLLLQGMAGGEYEMEDGEMEDGEGIMEDGEGDAIVPMDGLEEGDEMADGGGEGEGEAVEVQLTEEEAAAVQRLQAMFPHLPQMMVVQTFVACGKAEDLCANLLMDGQ